MSFSDIKQHFGGMKTITGTDVLQLIVAIEKEIEESGANVLIVAKRQVDEAERRLGAVSDEDLPPVPPPKRRLRDV